MAEKRGMDNPYSKCVGVLGGFTEKFAHAGVIGIIIIIIIIIIIDIIGYK